MSKKKKSTLEEVPPDDPESFDSFEACAERLFPQNDQAQIEALSERIAHQEIQLESVLNHSTNIQAEILALKREQADLINDLKRRLKLFASQ